jgi:hypothetical protein
MPSTEHQPIPSTASNQKGPQMSPWWSMVDFRGQSRFLVSVSAGVVLEGV